MDDISFDNRRFIVHHPSMPSTEPSMDKNKDGFQLVPPDAAIVIFVVFLTIAYVIAGFQ